MGKDGKRQQLERALSARFLYFKDKAEILTLECVRRLVEKDLGLKKMSLDAHKQFIRQFLDKKFQDAENDEQANEEAEMLPEENQTKREKKNTSIVDEETLEDSPILGVLYRKSDVASEESSTSESCIKKAIWKRADYLQTNAESINLRGVRRLLEEDLGLETNSLDIYKKFISQEIDQVLNSPKDAEVV